ncbi:MAG TPA: peptidase C69 [Cytophagales bacterium]|nr:peptidase C69 [Cytophagales bacterium]
MAILSRDEAKQIIDKVLSYSKADNCEVQLGGSQDGNIRYARNTVSTSGTTENIELGVSSSYGKKTGVATINELDDESLAKVVARSEELARLSPENPEYMEPVGPNEFGESKTFYDSTAGIDAAQRAEVAKNSIMPAAAKDVTAAGFLEHSAGFNSIANNKGLFAYNTATNVDFTVTMRSADGTGSGWATADQNDIDKLDLAAASQTAIVKALLSRKAQAIEPGKYTVILEPAAAAGLLGPMLFSMDARSADEGRSFLSKQGGGTKLGEKLVDERVNIYSDPNHDMVPYSTWSGDGLVQKPVSWVKNGVVENMFYSRYWAEKSGVAPMPFPGSAVMDGGDASLEDLIKDTKKGILVTRTWYIRSVDPQTLLYTGLTRDGTFFIENGQLKYPVKNFRFNESPIIMLNNLEALGQQVRINGNLIPYMKIRDFTFTSLSDAV